MLAEPVHPRIEPLQIFRQVPYWTAKVRDWLSFGGSVNRYRRYRQLVDNYKVGDYSAISAAFDYAVLSKRS